METRKRITLESSECALLLDGYPVDGAHVRAWHGTGVLTYFATGQKQPFLFETETWGYNEARWMRPFEEVFLAVIDRLGIEQFPVIKDRTKFTEWFIRSIQQSIVQATLDGTCLPFIHIAPLRFETLAAAGIVEAR